MRFFKSMVRVAVLTFNGIWVICVGFPSLWWQLRTSERKQKAEIRRY